MMTANPLGRIDWEKLEAFYGVKRPVLISQKQYDWLKDTHAFHAGDEFIWKKGDPYAMHQWWVDHDLRDGAAQAHAEMCLHEWMKREASK